MTVWVFVAVEDGETRAFGVYSTRENAEAAKEVWMQGEAEQYGWKLPDDEDERHDFLSCEHSHNYWIMQGDVDQAPTW